MVGDETGWDGIERRRSDPAARAVERAMERLDGSDYQMIPPAWLTAGALVAIAVLALQFVTLVSQFRLADRGGDAREAERDFRRAVTCFVVEITKAEERSSRPEILSNCGFIDLPRPGR